MIVETLVNLLEADPAVAALVGERIYPRFMPDAATFPLLVVTKATGIGSYDLQGDAGLEDARVQVDCYSDRGASEVITLRNAVRRLLSGFKGGTASGNPCSIVSSFVINDLDLSEPNTERAGPRLKRRMLEFRIWNREL
jgi:hypothetical protein